MTSHFVVDPPSNRVPFLTRFFGRTTISSGDLCPQGLRSIYPSHLALQYETQFSNAQTGKSYMGYPLKPGNVDFDMFRTNWWMKHDMSRWICEIIWNQIYGNLHYTNTQVKLTRMIFDVRTNTQRQMFVHILYLSPCEFRGCAGSPPFYRYKPWGHRSPPQGNLYRMGGAQVFFEAIFSKEWWVPRAKRTGDQIKNTPL